MSSLQKKASLQTGMVETPYTYDGEILNSSLSHWPAPAAAAHPQMENYL